MSTSKSKATERAAKAAALRAEQERRERNRRLVSIVGVVVAMVLIVGGSVGWSLWRQGKDDEKLSAAASKDSAYGVTIGPATAPHKVVIYEDFLCPFCGELEKQTSSKLHALAADGKVQVEYRPFNLLSPAHGDYSVRSLNAFAVVLDKAGADAAVKLHDLLYQHQPEETAPDSVTNDDLVDLAVEAGATESDVRAAIEGLGQSDWVDKATAEASAAGVSSTPTILLDGKPFDDGRTVDELAGNLLSKLG